MVSAIYYVVIFTPSETKSKNNSMFRADSIAMNEHSRLLGQYCCLFIFLIHKK